MTRAEFSRTTRRNALSRSGGLCEASGTRFGLPAGQRCNAPLGYGVEFHHDTEAEYGGDNSLGNCLAVCLPCHRYVTREFVRGLRKADRARDKHSGAVKPSARPLRRPPGSKYDWKRRGYVRDAQEAEGT